MSLSSHESSARMSLQVCSCIMASISSSAGTLISPWVTEFKKQRKNPEKQGPFVSFTLMQRSALLHASLCPRAHVFKHQLLKWLTTKYLKCQSLLTKSTEGKYQSFKWNTGCLQLRCYYDVTLAVFSRDDLCVSVRIYTQSKHTDVNMHLRDNGVSVRSMMREKWL